MYEYGNWKATQLILRDIIKVKSFIEFSLNLAVVQLAAELALNPSATNEKVKD